MVKLTEKKLCDICEKIVKIKRLQGSGITEDIFKGVKQAKVVLKNLEPVGKKLINDLVKGFNQGKISIEEAIKQASPIVQTQLASKSGGAFYTGEMIGSFSSGPRDIKTFQDDKSKKINPAPRNLPEGTSTSQMTGEGAVIAGEERMGRGAVIAGEGAVIAGEGSFPKHKVVGTGKKRNLWLEHLKEFRKKNPNLTYKEAMIQAKKSYKK